MELKGDNMARKTQISKDVILQAALKMLIRDGYSAINIKTLSKEIGCSTQPLVWHFENMEELRKDLSEYALNYANEKMCPSAQSGIEAFEQIGEAFIHIAVAEPNLFRFLYLEGYSGSPAGNFDAIVADEDNVELIKRISGSMDISVDSAERYLQNTITYTYGIAALSATGIIKASETEIMKLVNRAGDAFLMQEGVPAHKIPHFGENEK